MAPCVNDNHTSMHLAKCRFIIFVKQHQCDHALALESCCLGCSTTIVSPPICSLLLWHPAFLWSGNDTAEDFAVPARLTLKDESKDPSDSSFLKSEYDPSAAGPVPEAWESEWMCHSRGPTLKSWRRFRTHFKPFFRLRPDPLSET